MNMRYKADTIVSIVFLFLVYAISCVFKLSANIVMPIFQETFSLSASVTGFITGAYYMAYAPMQLFTGPLCHKYGPHKVLGVGLLFALSGALCWSFANHWVVVFIGRALIGLGVGPAYVSTLYYVTTISDNKGYAFLVGIAMAAGAIGSAVASGPIDIIIETFGIHDTFIATALILFTVAVILFILDKKSGTKVNKTESAILSNLITGFKYMLKSPALLIGTTMWSMFNAYQLSYQGLWSAKWFSISFPPLEEYAGLGGTICSLGLLIGNLLSDRLRFKNTLRYKSCITSEFFYVFACFFVVLSHNPGWFGIANYSLIHAINILTDLMFGFGVGHICVQLTAYTREITSTDLNATVIGIMNAIGSLVCIFFQWCTGAMYDAFVKTSSPNESYTKVFFILTFIVFLSALSSSISQRRTSAPQA